MTAFKWDNFLGILFLIIVFVIVILMMFVTFKLPETTVNIKPVM